VSDIKKSSIGGKSTCHLLNIKSPGRVAKRIKFSFKRTRATITVLKTDRVVDASMGFIDISETGAGFFTQQLLLKGSTVEVSVMEPRILKVKALVAWSVPLKSGIQNGQFGFRSGLQFIFENEVQRTTLVEFINKANSDPLEYAKGGLVEPSAPSTGIATDPAAVPAVSGEAPTPAPSAAATTEAPSADVSSVAVEVAAAPGAAPAPEANAVPAAPEASAAAPSAAADTPAAAADDTSVPKAA
jgi:hypothetical protein